MITKYIDRTWYMVIHTGQDFVYHKEKNIKISIFSVCVASCLAHL